MEAAARARCLIAYRSGDYLTARGWDERLPALVEEMGDYERLHQIWMTIAALCLPLADWRGAEVAYKQALALQQGLSSEASQVLRDELMRLQAGTLDQNTWNCWLPALPGTMQRLPSHLFIPQESIKAAGHK